MNNSPGANPRMNALLPLPLPQDAMTKILLVMLRRMAVHGLRDAHASQMALGAFGVRFQEAISLARCLLHETALASRRSIHIASCCTPRMTRDEALMLDVITKGDKEALAALTDNEHPTRALTAALALGDLVQA